MPVRDKRDERDGEVAAPPGPRPDAAPQATDAVSAVMSLSGSAGNQAVVKLLQGAAPAPGLVPKAPAPAGGPVPVPFPNVDAAPKGGAKPKGPGPAGPPKAKGGAKAKDAGAGPAAPARTTGPAPGAPGGPPAATPFDGLKPQPQTAGSPASGVDWEAVLTSPLTRGIFEVSRLVPIAGLPGGIVADGLQTYSDFDSISGEEAPWFKTALGLRDGVNILNNALGHVMYVDQLVQDFLAGSVVAAEFTPITAWINETGKSLKVVLDSAQVMLDIGLTAGAEYNRMHAAPGSPSAKAWEGMSRNYASNIMGDLVTLVMDGYDLATAGAGQGGALEEGAQAAKGVLPLLKKAKPFITSLIQSWWNIYGSNVLPQGVTGDVAFGVIGNELRQIKAGYVVGDQVLDLLVQQFTQQKDQALEMVKKLSGDKDPFVTLRDAGADMVQRVSHEIQDVVQMEQFATSADEKAKSVKTFTEGLLGSIDSFQVPQIKLPAPKGDGVVEQLEGAAVDVANQALQAAIGRVTSAVENAKGEVRAPVQVVHDHAADIAEFMQILQETAKTQVGTMTKWMDDMAAKLAKCKNGEEVIDLVIQKVLGIAGVETDFKIQDIRDGWRELGVMIDAAVAWADRKGEGGLPLGFSGSGGPRAAPAPPPDAKGSGSTAAAPAGVAA